MRYTREQACLAWLAQGMLGSRRLKKLLDEYGSAEAAYDAFQRDHGASLQNRISDYSLSLLRASASREKLHDMLVTMRKWNMGLVSMADDMYPESLRNIPEPPYMLFYQGDLRAAEGRCITVIGSRSATVAGIAATKSLCRDLSKQGVCIVSGLAVGIDAAAHEGCLDGGSPTIGVAASGLNVPYPSENVALKARILSQGGLLLSEYPPDMQSSKYVFAVRNRILAGLGHAVVLMEARIRSGKYADGASRAGSGQGCVRLSGHSGRADVRRGASTPAGRCSLLHKREGYSGGHGLAARRKHPEAAGYGSAAPRTPEKGNAARSGQSTESSACDGAESAPAGTA
mgnify:CR=1 FL=1